MHFEPSIGSFAIEHDIFVVRYIDELVIDLKVAHDTLEIREAICSNKKYATYWDCRKVKYWTKEARDFQATERNCRLISAGGCLYSESLVANVIINFYLKFSPPACPLRFFSTEDAAKQWLRNYVCPQAV